MIRTTISFTDTNAHQLLAVLRGTDVTGVSSATTDSGLTKFARKVQIQSDPDNGPPKLYFGSSLVSSTDNGADLLPADSLNLESPVNSYNLENMYLRVSANGSINVVVEAL